MDKLLISIISIIIYLIRYILATPFIILFLICHLLNSLLIGLAESIDKISNSIIKFLFSMVFLIIQVPLSAAIWIYVIALGLCKIFLDDKSYKSLKELSDSK